MFRRLIHNNVKIIGVRKNSNYSNDVILQHLRSMDFTLDLIYINSIFINIYMGLYFLSR